MFMEIDEVAIKSGLWESVKAGDEQARDELRQKLDSMELYAHALSLDDENSYVRVTIRDLNDADVLDYVILRFPLYVRSGLKSRRKTVNTV